MVQVVKNCVQIKRMIAPFYMPSHPVFDPQNAAFEYKHVNGLYVLLLNLLVGLFTVVFTQMVLLERLFGVNLHKVTITLVFRNF